MKTKASVFSPMLLVFQAFIISYQKQSLLELNKSAPPSGFPRSAVVLVCLTFQKTLIKSGPCGLRCHQLAELGILSMNSATARFEQETSE